jgi:hypothetical protein
MTPTCRACYWILAIIVACVPLGKIIAEGPVEVSADVRDASTGKTIASRVYILGANGTWHFPRAAGATDAVRFERENYWDKAQVEKHTTLAAKLFNISLPAGKYTVTVERGKEYLPLIEKLTVDASQHHWDLRLTRWIDMASRGWYSGDGHCHRSLDELPNLMLAEDVNVCFPLTYWTTSAEQSPEHGDKTTKVNLATTPMTIDANHIWYPRNTEYEIFKVGGKEHTLGAFLILNHRTPFNMRCLPLSAIAKRAHDEGALIDLEKHNWEWAAIAAPILPVDLYELANNHDWRIGFGVKNWGIPAPVWLNTKGPRTIDNESDWLEYGWRFYYALLNCGLKIKPTAGSASGAHPVPLGYSRVYVHLPQGFSYEDWLAGLKGGRSFATTGPMLLVTVNDRDPGEEFKIHEAGYRLQVRGEAHSAQPLQKIEIVWNGEVIRSIPPANERTHNAYVTHFETVFPAESSGWLAARCVANPLNTGGIPFAHTGPWHVEIDGQPLKPRRFEVEFFLNRVEEEIERNRDFFNAEQLADYYKARDFWRGKLEGLGPSIGK